MRPLRPLHARRLRSLLPLAITFAACHTAASPGAGTGRRASATLVDANGRDLGTVQFAERSPGVVVLTGMLHDLPPGSHGIHLHAVGQCDGANAFASAGAHFNPGARKHGLDSPEGPHAGDLPMVVVGADGRATLNMSTNRVTLGEGPTSLFDADGSSLVLHAAPDDQRTDPSGNSGARIACGVVKRET
ncbi:MAG TPA: superoxide dismutase family protein [Gemmatimonadaceae bacterium]